MYDVNRYKDEWISSHEGLLGVCCFYRRKVPQLSSSLFGNLRYFLFFLKSIDFPQRSLKIHSNSKVELYQQSHYRFHHRKTAKFQQICLFLQRYRQDRRS